MPKTAFRYFPQQLWIGKAAKPQSGEDMKAMLCVAAI